jgi:galactose mutarotase-like enzyme
MPTTRHRSSLNAAIGELYTLHDERVDSSVVVAPQRGAIVTSMRIGTRELFYLQAATLDDPSQNVRGGIPVLFPSPGKLEGDAFKWGGRSGSDLKQHGFGRILDWRVLDTPPAGLSLEISTNTWTRPRYPWNFRAQLDFTLEQMRLTMQLRVENHDAEPLPFALGFHPYFFVKDKTDKAKLQISTAATQAFDNVQKQLMPFTGFDLTKPEVDMHLLDHGSASCTITLHDGAQIELRGSPEFTWWVVWTLEKKDYVCVEPWTAPGNALNTGDRLMQLAPGAAHSCKLELQYIPAEGEKITPRRPSIPPPGGPA